MCIIYGQLYCIYRFICMHGRVCAFIITRSSGNWPKVLEALVDLVVLFWRMACTVPPNGPPRVVPPPRRFPSSCRPPHFPIKMLTPQLLLEPDETWLKSTGLPKVLEPSRFAQSKAKAKPVLRDFFEEYVDHLVALGKKRKHEEIDQADPTICEEMEEIEVEVEPEDDDEPEHDDEPAHGI